MRKKEHSMSKKVIIMIIIFLIGIVLVPEGVINLLMYDPSPEEILINKIEGISGMRIKEVRNSILQIGFGSACIVSAIILYRKRN
jgi:hypothetical protein